MNYEKEKNKQIKLNLEDVEKNLDKNEYQYKIKRWCEKYNFDFRTIFEKAKKDYYFRAIFSKDPNKQNFFKKIAAKYIKNIKFVKNFHKLNNHGSKSKFLFDGKVFSNTNDKKNKFTKTIDFTWQIENISGQKYNCYAYHEFIKEAGGAQNNQFTNVKNTIKNANFGNESNLFFFICDGEYFTDLKFKELKSIAKYNNIHITQIIDLEKLLEKIVLNGI